MSKTRKILYENQWFLTKSLTSVIYSALSKNKRGQIFIDQQAKANGRGAYIKLDNEEALQAKQETSL